MLVSKKKSKQDVVRIEIEFKKLESLFNKGALCAVDIRPLNSKSKSSIWNLCLLSCKKRLQCKVIYLDSSSLCQQNVSEKI